MSARSLILLLVAALIAGGTAFLVRNRISGDSESIAKAPVKVERVLVAKSSLAHGMFVQADRDLEWVALPSAMIREHHIREGTANFMDFDGAVARRSIQAGEPLTRALMVKPSDGGFMPAVLEPGKRAVTISVTNISGNAGFVFPGDRVDLILTHKAGGAGDSKGKFVSETFVEDVRVLAVDQVIDNPENKALVAKTLTVEVSPRQAEMIGVAADLGKISVSLRSLANDPAASAKAPAQGTAATERESVVPPSGNDARTITLESDVSRMLDHASGPNPQVTVIRGGKRESLEFFQEVP